MEGRWDREAVSLYPSVVFAAQHPGNNTVNNKLANLGACASGGRCCATGVTASRSAGPLIGPDRQLVT